MAGSMALYDFLRFSGASSQVERVLLTFFYAEKHLDTTRLRPAEVARLLREAREPTPGNLHQVLARLWSDKLLNRVDGSYRLTNKGLQASERLAPSDETAEDEHDKTLREVSATLADLMARIEDEHVRDYVAEAISCLHPQVNATRSAICMGWSALIARLHVMIEEAGFARFNQEFARLYPGLVKKRKRVQRIEDLEDYKDSEILEVCNGMTLLNRFALKRLRHHLDLRNACGHPAGVKPGINVARSFFEEIVEYVLGR